MATFLDIKTNAGGGVTLGISPSASLLVGDLCVLFAKWEVSATDPGAPSATSGVFPTWNTLTAKQAHTGNGDLWTRSYYSICALGGVGTNISVAFDATSNFTRIHGIFFRPSAGPGFVFAPQTVVGSATNSGTNLTTVSSITPDARGVSVAFFAEYTTTTYTPGGGWTEPTGGDDGAFTEYRLVASAGAAFTGRGAVCELDGVFGAHGVLRRRQPADATRPRLQRHPRPSHLRAAMIQQKMLAPSHRDLQRLEVLERELEVALATGDTVTIQHIIDQRDAIMATAVERPVNSVDKF